MVIATIFTFNFLLLIFIFPKPYLYIVIHRIIILISREKSFQNILKQMKLRIIHLKNNYYLFLQTYIIVFLKPKIPLNLALIVTQQTKIYVIIFYFDLLIGLFLIFHLNLFLIYVKKFPIISVLWHFPEYVKHLFIFIRNFMIPKTFQLLFQFLFNRIFMKMQFLRVIVENCSFKL